MHHPFWLLALSMAPHCAPPVRANDKDGLLHRTDTLHMRVHGQENLLLKPFGAIPQDDVAD
ncbi:hypothetical protein [Geothrix sp. 21YS21S-2]|uniref:hypothetical protein n=1 Tax=Geothrix sp. 21YS21S-2 TaxID=3068893 RepID=UPI0027BA291E|nr:hypothetical protein [Geothrix sp. 21YS21S-2]